MSKKEVTLLIDDFDPYKEYEFQIFAVRGREQSKPLQAKHEGETLEGWSHLCTVFSFFHQSEVELKRSG